MQSRKAIARLPKDYCITSVTCFLQGARLLCGVAFWCRAFSNKVNGLPAVMAARGCADPIHNRFTGSGLINLKYLKGLAEVNP